MKDIFFIINALNMGNNIVLFVLKLYPWEPWILIFLHYAFVCFFCSVAYVSRSGGMSNELNNIISLNTNGVYEGIAIGGDRYPGTTFMDHILRYQDDPMVKMIILLGEVKFFY